LTEHACKCRCIYARYFFYLHVQNNYSDLLDISFCSIPHVYIRRTAIVIAIRLHPVSPAQLAGSAMDMDNDNMFRFVQISIEI